MRTYYDDFKAMTKEKMAGAMEDMTYQYKETRVPKTHYKKMLGTAFEEVVESNVAINLVNTYFQTMQTLAKENPKWFMQALLCLDLGIKPANIKSDEYQALELTYLRFSENKSKYSSPEYLKMFEEFRLNGTRSEWEEQEGNHEY
jgi:hypothetical protein